MYKRQMGLVAATVLCGGCFADVLECPDLPVGPSAPKELGFATAVGYAIDGSPSASLNNSGVVALRVTSGPDCTRSIILDGQTSEEIVLPRGMFRARAINDNGTILGVRHTVLAPPIIVYTSVRRFETFEPAVWADGELHLLEGGVAVDLNNFDQIVGYQAEDDTDTVVRWDRVEGNWRATALGIEGTPKDINDAGHILLTRDGVNWIWRNGESQALATPHGATRAVAQNMNDAGQAAGHATYADGQHLILWSDGEVFDFGNFGGKQVSVLGMNNLGDAVGIATVADNKSRAFLLHNNQMLNLDDLVAENVRLQFTRADAINDNRTVWAKSRFSSGYVFTLDPQNE